MKRIYLIFILASNLFLSKAQSSKINQAFDFFNQKQFSLAQSLFEETDGETALFYNARCSQELELEDAKELFEKLISDFPFSVHYDAAISCLADIHFSNGDFSESIVYLLNIQTLSDKQRFNLAYSYFQLDSLKTARYNFSKLLDKESDYQSPSKYYYAHISYQLQNYQTSLKWFKELQVDKKFKKIVPYYIAQIYYFLEDYDVLIEYLYPIVDQVIESRKTEVNRLLGEAYYREKDYLNAAKFLKIYADLSTDLKESERFMLGFSYYQIGDYLLAVENLDKIILGNDKQSQISSYYLGASYLRLNKNNFALQSFKKASKMNFDIKIKEESLFNYAKLAYEQDLPFENALSIFNDFSLSSSSDNKKEHIKSLSVSLLRGTSNYNEAYNSLKSKNSLSNKEKVMLQELTFFLAVQEFNNKNFNDAILFFEESINSAENPRLLSAAEIWLADSYYQLSDYKSAQNIYSKQYILANDFLTSLNTYNKAYTLFKLEQYSQATKVFRQFVKLSKDSMFLNDSYLRIADCYYMQKDFILAEKYYNKSLVLNLFDVDYALCQRSICFGVMGDDNQRIKLLSELAKNFSNSAYFDDALFLIAEHKKNSNLFSEALLFYDSVLTNTINDNLKAKSHLGKAVIYFNNDKVNNAISEYKFVVENFQNGSYFKEALLGLKAIYVGIAKVDEYISFINTIPKYKISVSEQDSLSYSAAFIKFSEQDFKTAKEAFTKYIDEFKEGIFINDAHYYNANSMLILGDSIETTKSYKYLVENKVNHYLEEALLYLSRLYFKKEDYLISNAYYSSLDSIASNNSIKRESCVRLMYGYEYIDSKNAMEYATKVLQFDKIDNWLVSKAKIIISRYDFELGNYFKAKNILREIVELDNNSEGAEAMYNLIYLTYLDDSLSLAEKLIFEMPNKFSDDLYIAKSFILLSDIYLKQNNKFQAKATLESIIENYSGKDLKIIAQKKREEIIESEIVIEKNEIDTYYMDIFEDDLEYELITDTFNKINIFKSEE